MLRVFFLWAAFFIISCNPSDRFSKNKSIPGTWDKDDMVEFIIPQMDTLKKYDLFINIRNTNDYRFNNLFLIVTMEFPHGKTITDTLEYRMANPDGTWMGKGLGSIKENKLWYKEGVSFFEQGDYKISIQHALRNNGEVDGVTQLEGITDVGLSIEENTN
jgi:gliding motility-associated lipoprotein GldH